MNKKIFSWLLAICMIIPCAVALSACGDKNAKRYIDDSTEKNEVKAYFNNVFDPLVSDEIQKTLTYTLTYEISLTQKLFNENNAEVDFEEIIGRPPENQSYKRTIESGYNHLTKNYYKRLLGVNSETGAQINEPLEFFVNNGTNSIHYDFDLDIAYNVSSNHADLIGANKSISGFTYFAKSYERFLVNNDPDLTYYYASGENYMKFREKFNDFSQIDTWLGYLTFGDTDVKEGVYQEGNSYYIKENIQASYPNKDIDGWALVEFTKEECKGFKAEFSISSDDEVERDGQTYTGLTEFKIKINEVVEFDKYDQTKEITQAEKAHFVEVIDTVRLVKFDLYAMQDYMHNSEMALNATYSETLALPNLITNAYDACANKQHFQIKAYADFEKTKPLALDGSTVVTSAIGSMDVYLDIEIDEGYAVVLENIVSADINNPDETETIAFKFNVVDLSQTMEYSCISDISEPYANEGFYHSGLWCGGNVGLEGGIDYTYNPIPLQNKQFMIVGITLCQSNS